MTKIELNPAEIFLAGIVWAALWGGLGWWANHKLSTVRDRRARKFALQDARNERRRHFNGFMSGFRSWAERTEPSEVSRDFADRVNAFRVEIASIKDDLPEDRQMQFVTSVTVLCFLTAGDVSDHKTTADATGIGWETKFLGRDRLTKAIDAVMETLR